ncbi:MAG: hypothetical protein A2W26_04230 [Acidobacteria bacterium RBG_16_64_8]|nr:MAG: hypothetical protein A2W26_04230 [Acidobacteria bacterium RBG_16_64_8]
MNRPGRAGSDWSRLYRETEIEDKPGFLRQVFSPWLGHLSDDAAWFVWHASRTYPLFAAALEELGILVHQQIIWIKPAPTFGYVKYRYRHEPCIFGWPKGHRPYYARGWFKGNHTSVWEADWDGKARPSKKMHPTEKPTAVFALPIKNHTKRGAVCAEPFAGSGSQYVAAEELGRAVYGMEIVPEFVAAVLERLAMIGLKPRLVS